MRAHLSLSRRAVALAGGLLAVGAAACSDSPPADDEHRPPPASPDAGVTAEELPRPESIETVAPQGVRAGDVLEVHCVVRDAYGEEIVSEQISDYRIRFSPSSAVEVRDDGRRIATRAGAVEAVCSYPLFALLDEAPPIIDVTPGPVASVTTSVDRETLIAGGEVEAFCEGFDAWGNRVEEPGANLRISPQRSENELDGLVAMLARSGVYELVCDRAGAASAGVQVEVFAGSPASIVIARVPSRPIYGHGEIIEIDSLVLDGFGNAVPEAEVALSSIPSADVSAGKRLRYLRDGEFEVTATVIGPTPQGSEPPTATTTITVDGSGPTIACNFPGDGDILEREPGEPLVFEGSATDLSGVSEVRINGEVVGVDSSGNFAKTIPTRFGINFVRLSAIDELETETTRTCSFLVAESFSEEDRDLEDAVAMALNAEAVDDGSRDGDIRSLADVLYTVLNSDGLHQTIHELLLDNNPLKPMSCDLRVLWCQISSQIDYLDSEFPGPNEVELALRDGGFTIDLSIQNARLDLDVSGTFNTTGTVTIDEVTLFVPFDAYFDAGRPRVRIVSSEVEVEVGSFDTDFEGVSGWFMDNVVIPLARGRITDMLEGQVADMITGALAEILDDLMAHLDIGALATILDVPRLDGGEPIPLRFDPGLSSLDASSQRLLFGLSTRFSAPILKGRSSPGAPIELPPGPRDPGNTTPMGVALHAGILNQVLHALWRADFFDAELELGEGDGLSATIALEAGLPPVAIPAGTDEVELSLGNLTARLVEEQLFPEGIQLGLGVRARVRVSADAEEVSFFDFSLEEVYLTSFTVSLDSETTELLEDVLGDLLGGIIERALDDALPALPVPSFALPEAVVEFGLPEGAQLGLESAALSMARPFVLLRGALRLL